MATTKLVFHEEGECIVSFYEDTDVNKVCIGLLQEGPEFQKFDVYIDKKQAAKLMNLLNEFLSNNN